MHAIGRDVSSHSKSPGKFVPDMWKSNPNVIPEFESLKQQDSGTKIINQRKAQQLMKQFSLKTADGRLGNTGISLKRHTTPGLFILQK